MDVNVHASSPGPKGSDSFLVLAVVTKLTNSVKHRNIIHESSMIFYALTFAAPLATGFITYKGVQQLKL